MNGSILRGLRSRPFQGLWERLYRLSLIGMNFWASDLFATGEIEALRHLKLRLEGVEHPVIFDVGANVGDYSRLCLERLGPGCVVHAFEPSAATFAALDRATAPAGCDRLRIHQLGFSDREREETLYSPGDGSTLASLHELDPLDQPRKERTEQVRLTTIDAFCVTEGIDRIDFLKLDIEGHEYPALVGAQRMIGEGRIRAIQFEFGENNVASRTYMRDFIDLLGDRYVLSRVVPGGLVPWSYRGGTSEIFATMNYFCELREDQPVVAR